MHDEPSLRTDGPLARVEALERRVDELERAARLQERRRRRSVYLMLVAGVLYVLVLYWEMRQSIL